MKIDRVQIGITTHDGERKLVTLPAIRKHCRKERVEDLLEDLTLICEDVESARERTSSSVRLRGHLPGDSRGSAVGDVVAKSGVPDQ